MQETEGNSLPNILGMLIGLLVIAVSTGCSCLIGWEFIMFTIDRLF